MEPTGIQSAKDYGGWLEKHGYVLTNKTHENAKIGAVAILNATDNHKHGHIQIKSASGKWISDFEQNMFTPWRDVANPVYRIYE